MGSQWDLHPSNNFFLLRKSTPPPPFQHLGVVYFCFFFYTPWCTPYGNTPFPATDDTSVRICIIVENYLRIEYYVLASLPKSFFLLVPHGPMIRPKISTWIHTTTNASDLWTPTYIGYGIDETLSRKRVEEALHM